MVEKFEIKNIKITSCKKCANKISANWSYQMPSDTIQRVEEKEHRLKFMSFVCRSVDDGIVHAIGRSLACWLAHKFTCFLLRYAMCMNSFLSLSLRHSFSSALCSSAEQFFSGSVRCGCSLFPVFSSFLFSFDLYILLPSFTIHLIVFWSTFYTKRVCAVNQNFYFLFKMK